MALAPIPIAARGLSGQREPTKLRTGDLSIATNLDFSVPGLVQKEPGSVKVNAVALAGAPVVAAGKEFWPTESAQRRVVVTQDGKIYRDDMTGAFGTTLKSGLTGGKVCHIVEGGAEGVSRARKLFFMNGGVDPVQVLAGDAGATANIATPPADWTGSAHPTFMFPFRGFLIAGGVSSNPHFLYGCLATDHEVWTGGTVLGLLCYPSDGRHLVAGISALGRAWVFKWPRGVFWIDDSASAVTGWFVQPLSRELGGAPTPWCATQIEDATIAFMSDSGHIVLIEETAGALAGAVPVDLTKELNLLDVTRTEFNLARLDQAQLHWYKEKKQLHALYAGFGTTQENRRLIIDFSGERPRAEITRKDLNSSLWFELESDNVSRPRIGDNAGFVRKLDQVARTVDGSAYPFQLQTAPSDLSDLKAAFAGKKEFYRLHLEFVPTGNFDVTCGVIIDGRQRGTVTFNMGAAGSQLPFVLPGILGGFDLRRRSHDIAGQGYTLALEFLDNSSSNPQLSRAWAEFDLLGMQP